MKKLVVNYIYEDVLKFYLANILQIKMEFNENKFIKTYINDEYIGKLRYIFYMGYARHYVYLMSTEYINGCIKVDKNIYGLRYIDFDYDKELKLYI